MSTELGLEPDERGGLTGYTYKIARALAELRDAWNFASEPALIEAAIFTIMSQQIFRIEQHRELMERVLSHGMDQQTAARFIAKVVPRKGRPA